MSSVNSPQADERRTINEELEKLKNENTVLMVCITLYGQIFAKAQIQSFLGGCHSSLFSRPFLSWSKPQHEATVSL